VGRWLVVMRSLRGCGCTAQHQHASHAAGAGSTLHSSGDRLRLVKERETHAELGKGAGARLDDDLAEALWTLRACMSRACMLSSPASACMHACMHAFETTATMIATAPQMPAPSDCQARQPPPATHLLQQGLHPSGREGDAALIRAGLTGHACGFRMRRMGQVVGKGRRQK
jgi:hypothetical protein